MIKVTPCLDGCGDPAYFVEDARDKTEALCLIREQMIHEEGMDRAEAFDLVEDFTIGEELVWRWVPAPDGHECSQLIKRAAVQDQGALLGRWCCL